MVTRLYLTLYLSTFSCDGVLNCECTQQCDGVLNCVRQEVGSEYMYCVFNGNCIYKCITVAALFAAQLFHLCMATNIMSNLNCDQSDFKMISTLLCDGVLKFGCAQLCLPSLSIMFYFCFSLSLLV